MRARTAFLLGLLLLLPVALFAQDAPTDPEVNSGVLAALSAVGVVLAGYVSKIAYDGLKTIIPPFDRLPAIVHQVAAPLFGLVFGAISSGTGAALLTDIHAIDAAWIGGILVTLVQAGFKRLEKAQHSRDTTVVLEATRKSPTA